MKKYANKCYAVLKWLSALACTAIVLGQSALADDTELFLGNLSAAINPSVSIVDNTAEALAEQLATNEPYDSNRFYAGDCDDNLIYWTDVDATPDCSTTRNIIDKRHFLCNAALRQLAARGNSRNMLAQFRNGGNDGSLIGPYRWQFLAPGHANSPVECLADLGIHGDGRSNYRWPSAATNASDPFTNNAQDALAWGSTPRNRSYAVYDGNYLNWIDSHDDVLPARSDIIKSATEYAESHSPNSCAMIDARSMTKPIVAVDAFNRTQHLNDIYMTAFDMQSKTHWPGDLKKYRIENHRIDDTSDLWSATRRIPAAASRKLFSNIVSNDLSAAGNAVATGNNSLRPSDFGLTSAAGEPDLDELIASARGTMGDSLHSQPAAVVYGGDASDPDTVVFTATNDGYVHAISGRDGAELWAFIPKQLLANLARLYFNPDTGYKHYGLDGDIVPVIKDADQDGEIDADDGDFAYLIFGMRRGGQTYFALDVTDKNAPSLLWIFDSKESGESWSTPSISRMHIAGALQNADKAVVVLGGGYDVVHDTTAHPAGADGSGAGIHILDLVSGERLWRAGMDAGANLALNAMGREMDRAIPNQVRVIDLNGDGLADRMYASDLGGQVWRFDVRNGQNANELVAGGVIAQLGADGILLTPSAAQTRRFYNAPDVSLVTDTVQQVRYMAISIGSGYRAHPFDLSASDRFFSIRDTDPFKSLSQREYDNYPVITTEDLVEVNGRSQSTITADDRGWMLELPDNEKVLAESLTFDDQVFVIAFTPGSESTGDCAAGGGKNTLYRLNIVNGDPIDAPVDSRIELPRGGIAPSPVVLFPESGIACNGDECRIRPLVCIGVACVDPELDATPVRTLWTQVGID